MTSEIRAITHDRERFLDLLLLADPSPELVGAYIATGHLFALFEGDEVYGVILLIPQINRVMEIKNLAVKEEMQGHGYGKALLQHAFTFCRQQHYRKIIVGTGNSSVDTLAFYQKAGFRFFAVVRNFFTDNYDEPIFENGIQCRDMLLLDADLGIATQAPIAGAVDR